MASTRTTTALTLYAAALTLAIPAGLIMGFGMAGGEERTRFTEIDVERINIIEPDGTRKLVISNRQRQTEGTIGGEEIPLDRERPAGMIFFNDDGDEVGGLVFGGDQNEGFVGLMFDQFKQDQVLGLTHREHTLPSGERVRMSGLMAWDRPKDRTLLETVAMMQEAEAIEDPDKRMHRMREMQDEGLLGVQRMFVGRATGGEMGIIMNDGKGRPRLLISVEREGEPSIQFIDEDGEAVRRIGPEE